MSEESQIRAWRIQADTIANLGFEHYREHFIHETPAIRDFLEDMRGSRFIICAPKGFGKTLLLIAKSVQVQELSKSRLSGAGGQIIDKTSERFPVLESERLNTLKTDYSFWKNIWRIAIQAACVKRHFSIKSQSLEHGMLQCDSILDNAICNPSIFFSATEFFSLLMEQTESDQIRIMQKTGTLGAYFNQISAPISLFIDNMEEYFEPILEKDRFDRDVTRRRYYRVESNEIWKTAQCALASAALELNETNPHVKIYCTIRHEAFLDLKNHTDRYQKILGETLQIIYDHDDYREIFMKNIALMRSGDLVEPKSRQPITRFLGQSNQNIEHEVTATAQPAFDYILRHTLHRPRDLMLIGSRIAEMPPKRRLRPGALQEAITGASEEILASLFTEMRPFVPIPDMEILGSLIHRNCLTRQEIEMITAAYLEKVGIEPESAALECAPFAVLRRIGLLGTIGRVVNADGARQEFIMPFEVAFDDRCELPTTEEFYLVHPCLDQFILDRSGRRYRQSFESNNIIGDNLPWRGVQKLYYVLKGDVCGFSKIMDSEYYPELVARMEAWAEIAAVDIHYYDVSGGDSVLFIHPSPDKLLQAVQTFRTEAAQFQPEPVVLRFGGSAGAFNSLRVVRWVDGQNYEIEVPMGLSLRHSARIEPLAKPGSIVVDDSFRNQVLRNENGGPQSNFEFEPFVDLPDHLTMDENKRVSIRKTPSDPPYVTRLWQVVALGGG
jgi:hypothetical protein